jgi:hypothetical protein
VFVFGFEFGLGFGFGVGVGVGVGVLGLGFVLVITVIVGALGSYLLDPSGPAGPRPAAATAPPLRPAGPRPAAATTPPLLAPVPCCWRLRHPSLAPRGCAGQSLTPVCSGRRLELPRACCRAHIVGTLTACQCTTQPAQEHDHIAEYPHWPQRWGRRWGRRWR